MAKTPAATIEVELIYALPREQIVVTLRVPPGTTAGEAIGQSGLLSHYPEIAGKPLEIGVFGQRAEMTLVLRDLDRIEIYRPLIADPKQARRTRERRARKSGNQR